MEEGKTQEATREMNAIASVLNAFALQNGTTEKEERKQVRPLVSLYRFNVLLSFKH